VAVVAKQAGASEVPAAIGAAVLCFGIRMMGVRYGLDAPTARVLTETHETWQETPLRGHRCPSVPSQATAATTRAVVPVSRVGWSTGANFAEWSTGISCEMRPVATAFA
jgi:hypothetical protein